MTETHAPYPQSLALVIGISEYPDPLMTPLGEAQADALAISDALADSGFHVHTLIGREATKASILSALTDLKESGPDDRIVVYFSGHTYLVTDGTGGEQAFLSASDTDYHDASTAIPLADFLAFWQSAKAKHIGFIFDAPFSISAMKIAYTISDATPDQFMTQHAAQVLSAGENGRTISITVLGALRAKAGRLGETEIYTFSDLAVYTQQRIHYEWAGKYAPVFGHLSGSSGGEMVLVMPPDGLRRGVSAGVAPVNYASSSEKTLVARRTAIFKRADVAKIQDEAMARAREKQQAENPQPAMPSWMIGVGLALLLIVLIAAGLLLMGR